MSHTIGGGRYEVRGPQRDSRVGTWHLLSDADGQPRGGLRLNALDDAEWDRLSGTLQIEIAGVLRVVDRVADESGRWLVTAVPAAPTVAQVLAARVPLPEPIALLIAVDAGQALAALHEAGLAHGALTPDAVVLGGDGTTLLAECGYAHALAGTMAGPGHDVTAWVKLLRDLAAPRQADRAKQLLSEAADRAEALGGGAGLTTALSSLAEQAAQLSGYGERSALAVLAALVPPAQPPRAASAAITFEVPAPPAAAPVSPPPLSAPTISTSATTPLGDAAMTVPTPQSAPKSAMAGSASVTVPTPSGAAVTVPVSHAPHQTEILPDPHQQPTLPPGQLAAQMERRKEEVLRFGRGVAPLPPPRPMDTAPMWEDAYTRLKPPNRWRRRIVATISALTTLVVLALAAWWLIQRLMPLEITSVTVALAEPLENRCDVEARVVATIRTNGAGGTITYRWLTSEGKTTSILSEYVNLGDSQAQVTLPWKFSGEGTLQAKATLQVLTPQAVEQSTEFTYRCTS